MKAYIFVEVGKQKGVEDTVFHELYEMEHVYPEVIDGRMVGEDWSILCYVHKKHKADIKGIHRKIRKIPGVICTTLGYPTKTSHQ